MKRVFIIHCWGASSGESWYPWLKSRLERKGFEVHALDMPDTEHPTIENWVSYLAQHVGVPDRETFFVGHSVGCQTIMRYVETLPTEIVLGGAVFVAGWFALSPEAYETPEEIDVARPWLDTAIAYDSVRKHLRNIIAIFSQDDPFVPLENAKYYQERLGAKTIIQQGMGHYDHATTKITELPAALDAILEISDAN